MKNRVMADRMIDDGIHILREVILKADDRGTQDTDALRLQSLYQITGIDPRHPGHGITEYHKNEAP